MLHLLVPILLTCKLHVFFVSTVSQETLLLFCKKTNVRARAPVACDGEISNCQWPLMALDLFHWTNTKSALNFMLMKCVFIQASYPAWDNCNLQALLQSTAAINNINLYILHQNHLESRQLILRLSISGSFALIITGKYHDRMFDFAIVSDTDTKD